MPEQLPEPQNPAHQSPETGQIAVPPGPSNFEGITSPLESESPQAEAIAAEINAEVHTTVPVESPAYAKERFSGLKKMWRGLKQGARAMGDHLAIENEGYRFSVRENVKARVLGTAALLLTLPSELERRAQANYAHNNPAGYAGRYGNDALHLATAPMVSAKEAAIQYVGKQAKTSKQQDELPKGKVDPFSGWRDEPIVRRPKLDPFTDTYPSTKLK